MKRRTSVRRFFLHQAGEKGRLNKSPLACNQKTNVQERNPAGLAADLQDMMRKK
jgi:hypothetical protein